MTEGDHLIGSCKDHIVVTHNRAAAHGMESVTLEENLSRFTDKASVSAWAVPAMNWAVGQGLIEGSNGLLRPQANASRAEVAAILMRFAQKIAK